EFFVSVPAQERGKWRLDKEGLQANAVVILKDENLPPLCWRMGRVESVIPGSDGVARVALIRTANGVTKRAISMIAVLLHETMSPVSATIPCGGSILGAKR
ncbi:hypothetical protein KR018_003568, partial [Drosophila ironensis]